MTADIKKLLNKRGWTGREIGQALLLSLTDSYKQALQGVREPKPLFSQAQLQKMIHSITDSYEGQTYNRYVAVHHWIMQYQAVANAYFQQVQGTINSLVSTITTAEAAENEYIMLEKLPLIMTEKQYTDYRKRRIEEQLQQADGAIGNDVFALVYELLSYFLRQLAVNPRKANPLKAFKKKFASAAVKTSRILDRYNKVWGIGYYTLPDGRRSDQMSKEEWAEALSPDDYRAYLEAKRGEIRDAHGIKIEDLEGNGRTRDDLIRERLINRAKLIFSGATEEEADRAQTEREIEAGRRLPCEWHTSEERPKGLKKWEILEDYTMLMDYYPALIGEDVTDEEYISEIEDFKAEFPGLLEALLSELDTIIETPEGGVPFSSLPFSEWRDTVIRWSDLYEMDFPGFRAEIESDVSIFDGNRRALTNGIAILRPSDVNGNRSLCIDDQGYYIEPEAGGRFSTIIGLERFTPANEGDYINQMEQVEHDRKTLEEGLYWLKGFDTVIEMLADFLDIPDFVIFKTGLDACLDRIEALNGMVYMLYSHIQGTHYANEEVKEAKLSVLRDLFYPFKGMEIEPTEEAIEKARRAVYDDLKGFEVNDGGIMNLFMPPVREEA